MTERIVAALVFIVYLLQSVFGSKSFTISFIINICFVTFKIILIAYVSVFSRYQSVILSTVSYDLPNQLNTVVN